MSVIKYLNQGLEWAVKGDFTQAADAFRQAIVVDPNCIDAYNNLGLVFKETHCLEQAVECFGKALELNPACPEIYNNLGIVRLETKQFAEAGKLFQKALELKPAYSAAYNNLGIVQSNTNLWEAAILSFERAIQLNPNNPETHFHLGIAQLNSKCLTAAGRAFRRAIELNPYYSEAYFNLGVIQSELKVFDAAVAALCQAVQLNPQFHEAYNNLGAVLRLTHRLKEAEDCLRRAIALKPDYAKAYNNLGLVLNDRYCLTEAQTCLRHSIELDPYDAETYNNLALVLKDVDCLAEAESCLQKAMQLRPDFKEAEFALAFLYLLQEQYDQGWEKYTQWKEFYDAKLAVLDYPQLSCPRWQGEELTGRKILLFSDQGFGDAIQFSRYEKLITALGAQPYLWVQQPLRRLMEASFTAALYDETVVDPPYDFSCSLSRLPYMFQTGKETIPQGAFYIHTSIECAALWSERLEALDGGQRYRVGVVWAGNPKHDNDQNRSIALDVFKTLFDINEVSWISLQVGERVAELKESCYSVLDLAEQLTDFLETAGVIANLDLVITVDSAVAHLAGAMGKPTWLLLPYNPDWRWQLQRGDSPWYPTMQLFRQTAAGDWPAVLTKVKEAIVNLNVNKKSRR